MYLIAGLGNPGVKYQYNRHNVGFLLIDYLKERYAADDFRKKKNYLYVKAQMNSRDVLLIKPTTFMNASGFGILSAMSFYKIHREDVMVIYDDVALPFGMIRIRERGSDGGHNGLKSIQSQLGSTDYKRIRVGVDAPEYASAMKDYVLGNFSEKELKVLSDDVFLRTENALNLMVENKINEAMNRYNERIGKKSQD